MNEQGIDGREATDADAITIFDWLVVFAENVKLIVLLPMALAILAYGGAQLLPKTYLSEAILSLPKASEDGAGFGVTEWSAVQVASIMISPVVLDPVIEALDMGKGRPIQVVRRALSKAVKVTVTKDGFLRINVTAESPEKAQAISNAVIDAWLKKTVPTEQQQVELEKRLAYANDALNSVTKLLSGLRADTVDRLSQTLPRGETGMSVVAVGELQARYFREVISIPKRLMGLTRDVVLLAPTLPSVETGPDAGRIASVVAMAGVFLAILSVLIRNSWRGAMKNPTNLQKWRRARAAFLLRERTDVAGL